MTNDERIVPPHEQHGSTRAAMQEHLERARTVNGPDVTIRCVKNCQTRLATVHGAVLRVGTPTAWQDYPIDAGPEWGTALFEQRCPKCGRRFQFAELVAAAQRARARRYAKVFMAEG